MLQSNVKHNEGCWELSAETESNMAVKVPIRCARLSKLFGRTCHSYKTARRAQKNTFNREKGIFLPNIDLVTVIK